MFTHYSLLANLYAVATVSCVDNTSVAAIYKDHKRFLWIPNRTDLGKMAAVVAHGRRKGQLKSTGNYISLVYLAFPCFSKNASNGSVQECVRTYAKVVRKDHTHLYAAAWLGK